MQQMSLTKDYFIEEYHRFRGIMCSKDYTPEQKLNAFKGFFFVYVNLKVDLSDEDKEMCQTIFFATHEEFNMRLSWQFALELDALMAQSAKDFMVEFLEQLEK